jgi:hypothetical protein
MTAPFKFYSAVSYRDAIARVGQVVSQASNFSSVSILIQGISKQLHKHGVHAGVQRVDVGVRAAKQHIPYTSLKQHNQFVHFVLHQRNKKHKLK